MEDDDDFGDLYTDVIQKFASTSQPSSLTSFAALPQSQKPSDPTQFASRSTLLDEEDEEYSDAGGGTSNSGVAQNLGPALAVGRGGLELNLSGAAVNSGRQLGYGVAKEDEGGKGSGIRASEKNWEADGGGLNFDEESFRFDLEEEGQVGNGDVGLEPVIPGLSPCPGGSDRFDDLGREEAGGDDWDSDDSEDDLQIVLNDNNHGPMAMEMGGVMGGELDDGHDEGLGIGADGGGVGFQHPGSKEPEWGEDRGQAADRERKECGEAEKLNAGMASAPKPGYVGHSYHPFHSQFKYVRPGAAPLQGGPAAGPIGAPGQIRPLINIGPMAAGRGRGECRPPGMNNMPGKPKGYGGPGWGNNTGGRIGLDFTLPSHKTIFEVDINGFEEKPWNNPAFEVTDFFNFGLTEESWKGYCKQLEQFRVASTMQGRIRVYESGRSEQEYDPDMPPELAAASGVIENAAEKVNSRKTYDNHIEVGKNLVPARPPIPTGRPIQVETGSGERPPSIDIRPPRIRDSDAIIEIVCEGFAEGQSSEDDVPLLSEHDDDPSKTIQTGTCESEDMPVESKHAEISSSEKKRLPSPMTAHHHSEPSGSGGHSNGFEDGHSRRLDDESPYSVSKSDNLQDDQRDGSTEHIDGKTHASVSGSPDKIKDGCEVSGDQITKDVDDLPLAVESIGMEDDIQHDKVPLAKNLDEVLPHSKRQKFDSRVNLSSGQDTGEDFKATVSGDNSRSTPGNTKEYQKSHDVGEEVVQAEHDTSMRNRKRHYGDDERSAQRRNRDERHDVERSGDVVKGRKDPCAHRDIGLTRPSYAKHESSNKRKERDSSEGVGQRRGDDPHGKRVRTNDYRKPDSQLLERRDEMGSKYSGQAWDGDRIEKEDHLYPRKQINGIWRGHHDKDVSLRQRETDESLKARHENIDDHRRRKNEENRRRDYPEKEDKLLSRRESPSLRKRAREDHLDQRIRDDQTRTRESIKDHHTVRQKVGVRIEKEKSERPNERDDRRRTKQYHEGSTTKREREEIREPIKCGRERASYTKEKYEFNDSARYDESKRRDRVDVEHLSNYRGHEERQAHGNQSSNHESKPRTDRSSSHPDHNGSSNYTVKDKKPKESGRNKDHGTCSQNSLDISKRAKEDDNSRRSEEAGTKHSSGHVNTLHEAEAQPISSRKCREGGYTEDDEQQQSRRGRSKLERWTSHKERDLGAMTESDSSLKVKETIRRSINAAESSVPVELADKPSKAVDPNPSTEEKGSMKDEENKTADQHLDTVAKLKKRSERFKLPMPSEKDATNRKTETEAETPQAEPEIKSERPPRKRRWISS